MPLKICGWHTEQRAAAACAPYSLYLLAGTQQMVACSCAFGNSLTLPLVFLMSLLPGHAVDRATGYIALFMIGW